MTQSLHPKYRKDIDGLRAVAVFLVVGFHAFPTWVKGGFIGVDIFFVISGFLISSIIFQNSEKGIFSFKEFYVRRIQRIFPALILVLIACCVGGWFVLLPDEYKQLGKHVAAGVGFVSNLFFWHEAGYFDGAGETKPLLHLWTLGVEEQFYIAWPLLFYLVYKWRVNPLVFIVGSMVMSFAVNVYLINIDSVQMFYSPITRFWELSFGSLLAYRKLHKIRFLESIKIDINVWGSASVSRFYSRYSIVSGEWKSILGVSLIAVAVVFLSKDAAYPGWWALLPTIGSYLLISAGPLASVNRLVLSNRLMVWFGLISYPLYLWHWPLLSFLIIYTNGWPGRLDRFFVVVGSIFLAWGTYKYMEKPVRYGFFAKNKRKLIPVLIGVSFLTGLFGIYSYFGNGIPDRFSETVQLLSKYKDDDFRRQFRVHSCLLSGDEQTFSPQCVETENLAKGKPLVLIWGDSHAAQLFRAIESLHSEYEFSLAQFTSSSCPPIIGFDKNNRPLCRKLNDFVKIKVGDLKPNTVILGHDWPQSMDENALEGLPRTVAFLRKQGVKNIILIGPVPHWNYELNKVLIRYILLNKLDEVPSRLSFELDQSIKGIDSRLKKLAVESDITYVSALDEFCNADGCMSRLSSPNVVLTSFDHAHLTFEASQFFIRAIKSRLGWPFGDRP